MTDNQKSNQMDSERAGRVPVVLRVKYVKLIGGNKYTWEEVSVVAVLKNDSARKFDGNLEIAHYDSEPGIPEQGEATVYLEPFASGDESRWKLLNGTAKDGVSHAK